MAGAVLGSAFGPEGALAGAALGGTAGAAATRALRRLGEEFAERVLGHREKVRAGAALAIATAEIKERLARGEKLRSDGFFDPGPRGRSDAEELAESIILKAQREPEERKVPYMGHLLAGIAFDAEVNAELAHQLTKAAERLTYRQLGILKLGALAEGTFALRSDSYRGTETFKWDLLQVLYECYELNRDGFVSNGGAVAFGPTDVIPAGMKTQGLGAHLYNYMKLGLIPDADVRSIAELLA